MHQAGLIVRWKKKWWEVKGECPTDKETRKIKPLDFESVAGAFFMVTGSITLGLLVLLIELIYHRVRRHFSEKVGGGDKQGETANTERPESVQQSKPVFI
jgi:hypothetical protein